MVLKECIVYLLTAEGKVLFDADWFFLVIGRGKLPGGFFAENILYILCLGHTGLTLEPSGFDLHLAFFGYIDYDFFHGSPPMAAGRGAGCRYRSFFR